MADVRVNLVEVEQINICSRNDDGFDLVIQDPMFGAIRLTPACLIEFRDPDQSTPAHPVWNHITFDELLVLAHRKRIQAR